MRTSRRLSALAALAATPALAACVVDTVIDPSRAVGSGHDTTFTWTGALAAGAGLSVRTANGAVEVRPGSGDRVELVALATVVEPGRPTSAVALGVEDGADGVTVCALLDGAQRCAASTRAVNVRVSFTVLLPPGRRLAATTGNGDVAVTGATASVVATAGNGRVTVLDARGPVAASTGNGDIELRRGEGSDADATLTTGNGSITATLPASFEGRVEASTGNGVIRSDFAVRAAGAVDARHLTGTVGSGTGALLRMTTGNGSVTLRKG